MGMGLDRVGQVRTLMDLDYSIHFHVWLPDTFLEFVGAVRREESLTLELLAFEPCVAGVDDEFIFVFHEGEFDAPRQPPEATRSQQWAWRSEGRWDSQP